MSLPSCERVSNGDGLEYFLKESQSYVVLELSRHGKGGSSRLLYASLSGTSVESFFGLVILKC